MSRFITIAILSAGAMGAALPALANDTGFAQSTHELRREGGRLCQVGHFHGGSGSGGTKSVALTYALKIYSDTTSDEYGTDWGKWDKAASKSIKYDKTGDGWTATVLARPCK